MTVGELVKELKKTNKENQVFIQLENKIIDNIGLSFDDLGDIELYEQA